jgi:hypothetical protein
MKRPKRFVLLLAASVSAIALLVYPATLSAADGKPTRFAITDAQQAFDFPAGSACSFELAGTPVSNNVYVKIYPVDENGDVRVLSNGTAKLQLTNVDTGKSIVVNVSGPATQVVHADGSSVVTTGGSVLVSFIAPFNPAGPATFIYTGHTVLSFAPPFGLMTLVSTTDNKPFDVCAALS